MGLKTKGSRMWMTSRPHLFDLGKRVSTPQSKITPLFQVKAFWCKETRESNGFLSTTKTHSCYFLQPYFFFGEKCDS